jgi:cytochrome c
MMRRIAILLFVVACAKKPPAQQDVFGDARRGRVLLPRYGCPACHVIPGVPGEGQVGPPLTNIARRAYLAGHFLNTPITMARWIQHPQQMQPGNAMPDCGVNDRDARDIAAYLFTLR